MGETTSLKLDVEAPKFVAFIGTIVMILSGIVLVYQYNSLTMALVSGIVSIIAGVLLFLTLQVGFTVKFPIPYKWWVLLVFGAGILVLDIITRIVELPMIIWPAYIEYYVGGLLVLIAGLLEMPSLKGKENWAASKVVLLLGAVTLIIYSIVAMILIDISAMLIVGIILGVILILEVFKVIPLKWWLVLIIGSAVFVLGIHLTGGIVILVGFILMITDN